MSHNRGEEDGNLPALDAGETGFDSPAPDFSVEVLGMLAKSKAILSGIVSKLDHDPEAQTCAAGVLDLLTAAEVRLAALGKLTGGDYN